MKKKILFSVIIPTYNRENNNFLYLFLNKRKKNISNKNIKFIEMDSFDLIDKFSNKKFDFIWVDGNHLAPQVQFDIFQSIKYKNCTCSFL